MTVINEAVQYLEGRLEGLRPQVGIILGSGLGKLADRIEAPLTIPYTDVPGFVKSTAIGHKGNFIIGTLGGKTVMAMQGRFHYYEGYPMDKVTLPVRVMVRLGIKALFVSNAAGGVNFDFHVGDLMIIRDHINKLPNPLIGPNLDEFGPRFPDMTRPYDPRLIALAEEIGREKGIELKKGVYLAGTGPSLGVQVFPSDRSGRDRHVHHPRGDSGPAQLRSGLWYVRHHQRGPRRLRRGLREQRG